jgi:hypothetical protein
MRQGGAYFVPANQASAFRQSGLTLALEPVSGRPAPRTVYIDATVSEIVAQYVPSSCQSTTTPCQDTNPSWVQPLLSAVQQRLAQIHGKSSIAAIYILDDYPGNIVPVLNQIHSLVASDNKTEATPRPTMCAFGATLDNYDASGNLVTNHDYFLHGQNFNQGITNFTSSGCDVISVYPYAPVNVPDTQVDWSMGNLFPYMANSLEARGWSPPAIPLVGTPQAFGYPDGPGAPWYQPTGPQLHTQTDAFCHGVTTAAGTVRAQSIVAYAWNDFFTSTAVELYNSSDLRSGLASGVQDCKAIWASS